MPDTPEPKEPAPGPVTGAPDAAPEPAAPAPQEPPAAAPREPASAAPGPPAPAPPPPVSRPAATAAPAPPTASAAPAAPAAVAPAARAAQPAPSAPAQPAKPGRRPLVKRHGALVRVCHWLNAVLLFGMIASGLQIYGAFTHFGLRGRPYYPNPLDGKALPHAITLGGWLAGGLNWHFALAWPFVLTGLTYLVYLAVTGEWRPLLFRPSDVPKAWQMQLFYLRLRKEHPAQGKHNALQKAAYNFIVLLGALSVLTGFSIYKTTQLHWLTALFGGYELARYWHFWAVWIFVGFTLVHVALVFLADPASLRSMITGWYRGRFPSHD